MSAKERKRTIIVGIFVFIGIILLFAGVLILGGQQKHFVKTVRVTTAFEDVSGLRAGNNVWFSGVKIGTIKSINFRDLDEVEIEMAIEEKSREYIRKDAIAKIGSDGIIGNKIIVIQGGSHEVPAIETGDHLQSVKGTDTDAMMSTLQVNNENLAGITEHVRLLSEKIASGEGTLGAVITDSLMAVHMKLMIANLSQTSANTNLASKALVQLTNKLNAEGTLINDLLTDTAVYAQLRLAVSQLQGVTQNAASLTGSLDDATRKLNQKDNAIGALLNDPEMAEHIKRTLENLEQSTEKLDENMEALQHNFLFRRYFRNQRKAAEANQ